jgi:hypothetical protein
MFDSDQRSGKQRRTQEREPKRDQTVTWSTKTTWSCGSLIAIFVVLTAKTAFKIYRGVLVKHSAVSTTKLVRMHDHSRMVYESSPILVFDDPAKSVTGVLNQ